MAAATPYLALDPAVLDANLAAMASACRAAGVALRPHVKGPKSPWVAARQLALGAVGVAAATLEEAAVMLDAGVPSVLLTSVLAPGRLADAAALADRSRAGRLAVVAHAPEYVVALAGEVARHAAGGGAQAAGGGRPGPGGAARAGDGRAGVEGGAALDVLLDLDVGQRRGGAQPGAAALAVAATVAAAPGLRLAGVQGYEGHLQGIADASARAAASAEAMTVLAAAVVELRAAGHAVPWVTTGGTATALLAARHDVITEVQPGSYALMDHVYAGIEGVAFGQAVHVVAAVTAVLARDEVIVDAGLKALGTDLGPPLVLGRRAAYAFAGDEHGRITGAVGDLVPGDLVRLVPAHADTTVDRHAAFVLPNGASVPVAARSH